MRRAIERRVVAYKLYVLNVEEALSVVDGYDWILIRISATSTFWQHILQHILLDKLDHLHNSVVTIQSLGWHLFRCRRSDGRTDGRG